MKTNYLLLLLLFICGNIFCQNIDDLKSLAMEDAQKVSNASVKEDVRTLLEYTHPSISKKYGIRQLKENIEDVYRTMEAQNIKIISSKIDEISEIKKEHREYHCLAKNTIKMNFSGRIVTLKSSLFGFYNKQKKHWSFIESNKLIDDEETKKIFRNFKTDIEIPMDEQIAGN